MLDTNWLTHVLNGPALPVPSYQIKQAAIQQPGKPAM